MGFKYKNIKKNVFIDRHKQLNVVENHKRFLNKMKDLKSYLVEFNEDSIIKDKTYLSDYVVGGEDH